MQPDLGAKSKPSAFSELGFRQSVAVLLDEISALYLADTTPWVVGYSGGKDSTATLQLVWMALARLEPTARLKPVYVISTDTLVENPIVAAWVGRSLDKLGEAAAEKGLPLTSHRLTPDPTESFWTTLIGRGYPAPRAKFRWCTDRLKIYPSNRFISQVVKASGEAIVVLGTRKAESYARARSMERLEGKRVRERLSPNGKLLNSYVYSPIEDWSNDDVWTFLMQVKNQWGFDNKELLTMYQGASSDGECPLVIDATTPSCGDSRFGCWVCTMVDKDKSMTAMIQNDAEKEWMLPLLELRNELDIRDEASGKRDDRHLRDFRRMNGSLQVHNGRMVHGPYLQSAREHWLRRVLQAQKHIREHSPPGMEGIELVSLPELREIRRLWVVEKHEIEDNLPQIYEEVLGEAFPDGRMDDSLAFGRDEIKLLREVCGDDLHFQLTREMLDLERQHRSMARRAGLFKALEQSLRRGSYDSAEEATETAFRRRDVLNELREEEDAHLTPVNAPGADLGSADAAS